MTSINTALEKLDEHKFSINSFDNGIAIFYTFSKPELTKSGYFLVTKHGSGDIACLQLLFKNGEFPSYYDSFNKLVAAVLR